MAAAFERRWRPAPLFEADRGSDWPIISSAVASQMRAALGCERGEIVEVMCHDLDPVNERCKANTVVNGEYLFAVTDALGICKLNTTEEHNLLIRPVLSISRLG